MKIKKILVAAGLFVPLISYGGMPADSQISFGTTPGGVDVSLEWYSPSTVRVVKTPSGKTVDKKSLSVVAQRIAAPSASDDKEGGKVVRTRNLTVKFSPETGNLTFLTPSGEVLLSETSGSVCFTPVTDGGEPSWSVYQQYSITPEEGIYGLGQLQDGRLSHRDMTKYLVQENLEDVTPIFVSSRGYGVFWDNYSGTEYAEKDNRISFRSDTGDCVDYYFMYGGDADGVISEIRQLTGKVPMMPLWSYGFMQSRERYKSQYEVLDVVNRYRNAGIPLDVVIQDWQYWGNNYQWNAMDFLTYEYNNPKMMIDSVHSLNTKMMISIWSSFGPQTKPYRDLARNGLLFNFSTWPQSGVDSWPPRSDYPSGVKVYDAYSPEARDIYWKYLNDGIYRLGMDGWWMDSTEPDHFDVGEEHLDRMTGLGKTYRSVRNAFPLMSVGGVYDHQRAIGSDKRVIILTRSGFLGQQRYGSNVWSGDVASSWDMFRRQIPAGLNFSLTGMPHWNSDLGGFFAGAYNNGTELSGVRNPKFQELYVRWMQQGALTPMMRSHGTDVPREIFLYGKPGEPVYDALVGAVKLRYSLLPYIYGTARDVTDRNSTFMRALFMDFNTDPNVRDIADEYMFGRSLLVAPVLHPQYTEEDPAINLAENEGWGNTAKSSEAVKVDFTAPREYEVYLPSGTAWYDFHTGERFDGGQTMKIVTSFNRIPLYARSGSIIPIGPDVQYASEKPWDNLTVKVYPGADGEFTLYEDEGDSYNYENGAFTEIPMKWNDRSRTLTIGKRDGAYPGMIAERKFTVSLPDGTSRTVSYKGKAVKVKM